MLQASRSVLALLVSLLAGAFVGTLQAEGGLTTGPLAGAAWLGVGVLTVLALGRELSTPRSGIRAVLLTIGLALPGLMLGKWIEARYDLVLRWSDALKQDPEFFRNQVLADEIREMVDQAKISSVLLSWADRPHQEPDPLVAPMLPGALEKATKRFSVRTPEEQELLWENYAQQQIEAASLVSLLRPVATPVDLAWLGLALLLAGFLGWRRCEPLVPLAEESPPPVLIPPEGLPLSGGPQVLDPLPVSVAEAEAPRPRRKLVYREGIKERNKDPYRG